MIKLRFKKLTAYPGYGVREDGTIWSVRKSAAKADGTRSWKKLRPNTTKSGHRMVMLTTYDANGKRKYKMKGVHQLVLEAFVGPCPVGMVARHFPDRNPANNRLGNLQWGTHKENRQDCILHGTYNKKGNGLQKLKQEDIPRIKKMIAEKIPKHQIAKLLNVATGTLFSWIKKWRTIGVW